VLSRDTPRTDAPASLPVPRGPGRTRELRELARGRVPAEMLEAVAAGREVAPEPEPLSEFQVTLVQLAEMLEADGRPTPRALESAAALRTEQEAAVLVRQRIGSFLTAGP
jgi:hypothetical protein